MTMTSQQLFIMLMLEQGNKTPNIAVAEQILENVQLTLEKATTHQLPNNAKFIQDVLENILQIFIDQLYANDKNELNEFKQKYNQHDVSLKDTQLFQQLCAAFDVLLELLSLSVLKFFYLLTASEKNDFESIKLAKLSRSLASYLWRDYVNNDEFNLNTDHIKKIIRESLRNEAANLSLFQATQSLDDVKGELVAKCLLLGADPDYRHHGCLVLQNAVLNNNYAQVEILLSQGALPNRRNTAGTWQGWGAAHTAAWNASANMIEILLKYNVNFALPLEHKNKFAGHTPLTLLLTLSIYRPRFASTSKVYRCLNKFYRLMDNDKLSYLVNTAADTSQERGWTLSPDWRGWYPLSIAVLNYQQKLNAKRMVNIIQLLLDSGADANLFLTGRHNAWRGFNAMHVFAYDKYHWPAAERVTIYRLLIQAGADIYLPTERIATWGYRSSHTLDIEQKRHPESDLSALLISFTNRNKTNN